MTRVQYTPDVAYFCENGVTLFRTNFQNNSAYSICTLRWRHKGRDGVSNHQPHDCFLDRLFRRRSKKTSKLRVTGLCVGNSPGTGEFPSQMASNADNVFIWWRHHECEIWSMVYCSTLVNAVLCSISRLIGSCLTAFDFMIVQGQRHAQYCLQNYVQIHT